MFRNPEKCAEMYNFFVLLFVIDNNQYFIIYKFVFKNSFV